MMGQTINYSEQIAKKKHICWWCGEAIKAGEKYARWRYADAGECLPVLCHEECKEAWKNLDCSERDCVGFAEFNRGCTCEHGWCKCKGG